MEDSKQFTCISYNNIEFLIQNRYVLFGIYLQDLNESKSIDFENEVLPHIFIGHFLENNFLCKPSENCNVMLVMKKDDIDKKIQKLIVDFTGTKFPPSGNFAISVNSAVSSRIIDTTFLRLMPQGIRSLQKACGISAIGFQENRQILISPDCLLRKLIKDGGMSNG